MARLMGSARCTTPMRGRLGVDDGVSALSPTSVHVGDIVCDITNPLCLSGSSSSFPTLDIGALLMPIVIDYTNY